MHFVGYTRVSFVGSRGGETFHSPDDQARAIRAWAKSRGHRVTMLDPELNESGGRADRPILLEAIDGIEAGKFDGLIAHDTSRVMRDVMHLLAVVDRITAAGGTFAVCEGDIDWLTSMGRMVGTIKGAIDEHVRRTHAERFLALNRKSAERGIWKFRQVPLGLELDGPRPAALVPSADADLVRRIFARRIAGDSLTTLGKMAGMTASGIRSLLKNRVYLGEIHVGQAVNVGAHEAIIDLETFETVQAMRSIRPPRGDNPVLLAGVIRCQSCGHIMHPGRTTTGYQTYGCHRHHSAGACVAPAAIAAHKVEAFVVDAVRAELESWRVESSRKTSDTAKLRDDLSRAKAELSAYLHATEAAGVAADDFIGGARVRREAVDAAQAALDSAAKLSPLVGVFTSGADAFDSLSVTEQNRLLRGLLDTVVVAPVGRGRNVPVAERIRIFSAGTLGVGYSGGGVAMPNVALPFPDRDDERLLGVARGED